MTTMRTLLSRQDNNYQPYVDAHTQLTGHSWYAPTWRVPEPKRNVSVVIPARDAARTIVPVLDGLARQQTAPAEVIVVDDASADDTSTRARYHPTRPMTVRLDRPCGAGQARNIGVALARGETILFLDADMVIPNHVVGTIGSRANPDLALLGFRHNIPHSTHQDGQHVPTQQPELERDHRVVWHGRAGRQLHTGILLDHPVDARPLDETADLLELGNGRTFYDWDLPRMVVTCLLAVARDRIIEAGGFHPGFTGWGEEDTHLGAMLIAAGVKIAPLRQVVGFHLDPPNPDEEWSRKLATWPANAALYQRLLDEAPRRGRPNDFATHTTRLLRTAEVKP